MTGRRYARNHNSRCGPIARERTWAASFPTELPDDECWPWGGTIRPDGYGFFTGENGRVLAHRESYERNVGAIPDGLDIDHVHERGCRRKDCVNPAHLEPVPRRENVLRGLSGRLVTHCPQGHEYTPENTTTNERGHRWCKACGRERKRARRVKASA